MPTAQGNISSETIFEALEVISRADRPMGVVDFHREMSEPTSSIHRAIATLEETDMVARHGGGSKFVPGPMCHHLVRALAARFPLRAFARPRLARLAAATSGMVTLNVRLGWYGVRLLAIEGASEYSDTRRIGEVRLLHEPVAPLTIMAFAECGVPEAYRRFVAARHVDQTAGADWALLSRRAAEGCRRAFLEAPDDTAPDRRWFGLPLRDTEGRVVAAVAASIVAGGQEAVVTAVAALQRDLDAASGVAAGPFSHVPADAIVLPVAAER